MKIIKIILAAVIITAGQGCADHLNEEVFSQLDPSNLLNSPDGVETVLFAAYNDANLVGHDGKSIMNLEDWSTDLEWETGGGENRTAELMINFTWDASTDWIVNRMWNRTYRAVRNANIVIDNLGDNLSDEQKRSFEAEARFVRAISFYRLYTWFESVPLRASSVDPPMLAKATKEDMEEFLEAEFLAMIPNLPPRGQEPM